MIKVLSWRFRKYFGNFHMLTVKACSETALFREWSYEFFTVRNFGNILALCQSSFVPKCLKFDIDSRNGIKNWEKNFYFLDNCIWIRSGKSSQSCTRYFSSAVIVLKNTPKISAKTRGDKFQINFHENDEKHDKSALTRI